MITLEYVKKHSRIEYAEEDDDYILSLIEVAASYVTSVTGVENNADAPPQFRLICCLLVAHWFNNREASTGAGLQDLPLGVGMLLASFRPVLVKS